MNYTTEEPEDINVEEEDYLSYLVRGIELYQGQYKCFFARYSYAHLRDDIAKRLKEVSPIPVKEITLDPFIKTLYAGIQEKLGNYQPKALMVFGLDDVVHIREVATSANQVREEFRINFPFPLILWVNNEVLKKLMLFAPEFIPWLSTTDIRKEEKEELLTSLEKLIDISWNMGKKAGWGGAMASRTKTDKKKLKAILSKIITKQYDELTKSDKEWLKKIDNYP
ncbi:MAG: hypothetical protein WBB28_14645 [Crinalium sp.]